MSIQRIARVAMLAALYTALCLALPALSYGSVQIRFSEALTLLPVLMPGAVAGVTLGCLLTNLVGCFTGANLLGALDVLFGTAATLLAALATRRLAKVRTAGLPLAAALPPILCNGVIIGAELTFVLAGQWSWPVFWAQAAFVALGEVGACALGVLLVRVIERSPRLLEFFSR